MLRHHRHPGLGRARRGLRHGHRPVRGPGRLLRHALRPPQGTSYAVPCMYGHGSTCRLRPPVCSSFLSYNYIKQSPLKPPPASPPTSGALGSSVSRLRRDEETERAQREQRRGAAPGAKGAVGIGRDGSGGFRRTWIDFFVVWFSISACSDLERTHVVILQGWSRPPATRSPRSPSCSRPTPPCSCATVRG